jgi:integrase
MLIKQKLSQGGGPESLVIGDGDKPFDPPNMLRNARRIWKQHDLTGLGYHECRHTYASLMIAAGVNAKTLSTYMGHSSIVMTMDRYGHLFPGNEQDSAAKLDKYLGQQAREAGLADRVFTLREATDQAKSFVRLPEGRELDIR